MEKQTKPFYKKWWVWIVGFIVISMLASIGGTSDQQNTTSVENTSQKSPAHECLNVSADTVEWIRQGFLNKEASLANAQAVKSDDFQNVYFVGVKVEGVENFNDDDIAVFAINSITETGLVLSVNSVAKQQTDWFHGDKEGAQYNVTINNDGAQDLLTCFKD